MSQSSDKQLYINTLIEAIDARAPRRVLKLVAFIVKQAQHDAAIADELTLKLTNAALKMKEQKEQIDALLGAQFSRAVQAFEKDASRTFKHY